MTTLLGILEFNDYAIIGGIVAALAGGAALTTRQAVSLEFLERQMRMLQRKVDALLEHQGIALPAPSGIMLPSGRSMSIDVQQMATPAQKIAAIKLHRTDHPGLGLAEAKADVEAFIRGEK